MIRDMETENPMHRLLIVDDDNDIRTLLAAVTPLRDGEGIEVPGPAFLRKLLMKKLEGTEIAKLIEEFHLISCLLYTSPSPRDQRGSRMPSSA